MKTERDLFKQAYLNLRTSDSIPFPDAVFDEYVRLRDSEGYKLVPLEPNEAMLEALQVGFKPDYEGGSYDSYDGYKAMMGVGERLLKID